MKLFESILRIAFWILMIQILGLALGYLWSPVAIVGAGLANLNPSLGGASGIAGSVELLVVLLSLLYALLSMVHGGKSLFTRNQ